MRLFLYTQINSNLSGTPPKNRAICKKSIFDFFFFFFLEAPPYKSSKTKEKKKSFFSQRYGQKTSKTFFGPNFMNIDRKK
jgi:hypothetical protein